MYHILPLLPLRVQHYCMGRLQLLFVSCLICIKPTDINELTSSLCMLHSNKPGAMELARMPLGRYSTYQLTMHSAMTAVDASSSIHSLYVSPTQLHSYYILLYLCIPGNRGGLTVIFPPPGTYFFVMYTYKYTCVL